MISLENAIKKIQNQYSGISTDPLDIYLPLYQSPNGKRCIIGLFIPDNHPGLKSQKDVPQLLQEYPELQEYMPLKKEANLKTLQLVHDGLTDEYNLDEQKAKLIHYLTSLHEKENN